MFSKACLVILAGAVGFHQAHAEDEDPVYTGSCTGVLTAQSEMVRNEAPDAPFLNVPEKLWVQCVDSGVMADRRIAQECSYDTEDDETPPACRTYCTGELDNDEDSLDTDGNLDAEEVDEYAKAYLKAGEIDKFVPYDLNRSVDAAKFTSSMNNSGIDMLYGGSILKDDKGKDCSDPASTCSCKVCSVCNTYAQCLPFYNLDDDAVYNDDDPDDEPSSPYPNPKIYKMNDPRYILAQTDCTKRGDQMALAPFGGNAIPLAINQFACTDDDVLNEIGPKRLDLEATCNINVMPQASRKLMAAKLKKTMTAVDKCVLTNKIVRTGHHGGEGGSAGSALMLSSRSFFDAFGADYAMVEQMMDQFQDDDNHGWASDVGLKEETADKLAALLAKFLVSVVQFDSTCDEGPWCRQKLVGNLEGARAVAAAIQLNPKKYSVCLPPGQINKSGWNLDVRKMIGIPAIQAELKASQAELEIADVEAFVAEIIADASFDKKNDDVILPSVSLKSQFGSLGVLFERARWFPDSPAMPRATLFSLTKVLRAVGIEFDQSGEMQGLKARTCFLAESKLLEDAEKYLTYGHLDFAKLLGNPVMQKVIKDSLGMTDAESEAFVTEVGATSAPWAGCHAAQPPSIWRARGTTTTKQIVSGTADVELADITGINVGYDFAIADGVNLETSRVIAVTASGNRRQRRETSGSVKLEDNLQNNYASGASVTLSPKLCSADEHVCGNVCTACPAGTTNAADDNAAGLDTACATAADGSTTADGTCVAKAKEGATVNTTGIIGVAKAEEGATGIIGVKSTKSTETTEIGATTMKFEDVSNINAGDQLTIGTGGTSEKATVKSVAADKASRSRRAITPGVVTFTAALTKAHEAGSAITWTQVVAPKSSAVTTTVGVGIFAIVAALF